VRNIRPRFIQADELWTFVGKKQKQVQWDDSPILGDTYLWIALDSETKAVLTYHLGKRDQGSAIAFMSDLSTRLDGRCQLTTDGLNWYLDAVESAFGADLDFAQLVKIYSRGTVSGPDWFRPGKVIAVRPLPVTGEPNPDRISTSHVERFNLTVRMHLRRFTRLTNAFSKSLEHLSAAIGLFVAWYNFCKIHQSVRVTPAMEAGITDHVWSISELLAA
jgi:IS1 family transposase